MKQQVILASGSPRRRELLQKVIPDFTVVPPDIDEVIDPNLPIGKAIEKLALDKAKSVSARYPEAMVISGDTIVTLKHKILLKPVDANDAKSMLRSLSGQKQEVITGVAIVNMGGRTISFFEGTRMKFRELSDKEIGDYVATGEPLDKAGAYAVQGGAKDFIETIEGDFDDVGGVPIKRIQQVLNS